MTLIELAPYLIIFFVVVLACMAVAHKMGMQKGATEERIRLTGSSLPRYENPPPPPKEKSVPKMPNHPPMPKFEEKPLDALNDKYKFNQPPKWCTPVTREVANEVTQDQLIDALMDMRIENFLAAHTIPAHAGTDLYYLSRKETAEYLLDMYHITPKAKH